MSGEVIFQEITFSPRGEGIRLSGEIAGRDGHHPEGVVICHPHPQFGGDMQYPLVQILAEGLAREGYVTLRFNFRGVGLSGGSYGGGEGEVRDALGAIDYLRAQGQFPVAAASMIGYSFGAWVGLRAAAEEDVKKAVALCIPAGLFDFGFLQQFTAPLLAIHGTYDQFTPQETVQDIVRTMPGPALLQILPEGDHFMAGREREILQLTRDFLEKER